MILCDQIEYKFRRFLDQKNTPSCATHAFLGTMAECVENKTGDPTDFDYQKEFKKLGSALIMLKIRKRAVHTGFRTLDGRLVKAKNITVLGRPRKGVSSKIFTDRLCELIQTKGACVASLTFNKKTSFVKHKNNILNRIYTIATTVKRSEVSSHAVAITGFDRQRELFTITNSYGKKVGYKYMKFDDLYSIFKSGLFIDDVLITKN